MSAVVMVAGNALAQQPIVIQGATVHPVAGSEYVGNVVIQGGRIASAGPEAGVPEGARVIDATGLHLYPGLFESASTIGLAEIGRGADVTVDTRELGRYNPHLQAKTAVHPASEHIRVARANGITHTLTLPSSRGSGFSGQGSVINLDGWTVEEMEIVAGAVMVTNWPSSARRASYRRIMNQFAEWLEAARHYDQVTRNGADLARDQRLEALARVTRGEMPLLVHVNLANEIRDLVRFAEDQEIRIIVAGAREAYQVARLLAEKDVPVILRRTQILPTEDDAPYDEPYAAPGRLHAAGVKFAIATFASSTARTLPYEAAMAIPYGLPRDAALRAITAAPAEILGLGDQLGTVEAGKIANLIVTDGDPLEIQTQVRYLFINGEETSTMNRNEELYQRHRSRPLPVAAEAPGIVP